MMIRADIEVAEGTLVEICQRYHVQELALFGSSARGDHRADSDVDVLVEFFPDAVVGFLELAGLQEELTELVGKKVDLVQKGGLKPLIRAQVLAAARQLYAA